MFGIRGREKVDSWAMGVILLSIMTRRYPFFTSGDKVVRQRGSATNRHDIRLHSRYGIGAAAEYVLKRSLDLVWTL